MRSITLAVLALAFGCEADDRPPSRPGGGGGGGGSGEGGGTVDAAPGPDATPLDDQIRGTVCALDDLRDPGSCDDVDLAGVVVTDLVSGNATTADAGGAFLLDTEGAADALLSVGAGDATLRQSLLPVPLADGSADGVTMPLVPQALWDELLTTSGVIEPNGTGSLAVYVRQDGEPVEGAQVIPQEGATFQPFYDTTIGPATWDEIGPAGPAGAALLFGNPAPADVTFSAVGPGGEPVEVLSGVPVQPDAVTFVFTDLGP